MKKILAVLIVACLMFSLCACNFAKDMADMAANDAPKAKTFEFDGFSIKLTTDFLRMDFMSEDYDFVVGTEDLTIMGMRLLHDETQLGDFTVLEFADYFRFSMDIDSPSEITEIDGIPTMYYFADDKEGEEQRVTMMYYKAEDCFWIVCFVTPTDKFDGVYDDICKYAKSVRLK